MKQSKKRFPAVFVILASLCFLISPSYSADGDQVFPLTATASDSPPRVTLSWTRLVPDSNIAAFHSINVYRRPLGAQTPTLLATISNSTVRSYTDNTVAKGVLYEYLVIQRGRGTSGFDFYPPSSWVASGVEVPLNESPGTVLLLVDESVAPTLSARINLFERNLIGAGWRTVRANVPRDTNAPGSSGTTNRTSDPRPTKQVITDTLAANPDLKAVILLGRVTIPFSGSNSPDGHGTRAHSTDAFYADTNEVWADDLNHASSLVPRNIPGDLRWDKKDLVDGRELMVGRIDFSGMNVFVETETQLLDRYLDKNHAFRFGVTQASRQGFWTTNAQLLDGTISNMTSYFGSAAVTAQGSASWSQVTNTQSYLWGAAGALGNVDSTTGINTTQMATSDYKVVFATAGSSYMMETWKNNSAVRGLIAMPTWGIASMVSHGYYGELIHPGFSMGRPIGEANLGPAARFPAYLSELPDQVSYIQKSIYANLHGDPTVTMYVTPPPSNLRVAANGAGALLSWNASAATNLLGYHVYRSNGWSSPFTRLTTGLVTGTSFTDATSRSGDVIYMVRAVNLETRGTGTYFAASQGIFAPLDLSGASNSAPTASSANLNLIEDNTLVVNPQGTDPDGDLLTPIIVRPPTRGKLVMEGTGYRYLPQPNFNGSDSFEFVVNDGYQDSARVTSNITIAAVNDPPVLADFAFTAHAYRGMTTTRTFKASDVENNPVTYRLGSQPSNGRATLIGDRLSYLPRPGFIGTDTLTIIASDGTSDSAPAVVTVTVTAAMGLENSSLRAWWKFDDAAGSTTAIDSNPGTTKFNADLQNGAAIAPNGGLFGGALRTSSTSDIARIATSPTTAAIYNGATSLWFRAADPANDTRAQVLMTMGSTSSINWNAYLRGGKLYVHFRIGSSTFRTDTVIVDGITANQWYHLAFSHSFDSDNSRMPERTEVYLNGVLQGRITGQRYTMGAPHGIGNQPGSAAFHNAGFSTADSWFDGWIDDVRYYTSSLTNPQVQALYDAAFPPPANQAPRAVAKSTPATGSLPLSVTWSGADSSDPDGTIYSYAWTFSDGGSASGPTVNRVYAQPGTYSATLTVTDNEGATTSQTVSITAQATTTGRGTPISWLVSRFGTAPDYEVVDATDHDGDGQPTWLEYRAGTDPQSATDSFRIVSTKVNNDGSVTLEWRGSSEHGVSTPFRVMASSDLTDASWQVRGASVPRATNGNTTWTDASPPTGHQIFYKVEAP